MRIIQSQSSIGFGILVLNNKSGNAIFTKLVDLWLNKRIAFFLFRLILYMCIDTKIMLHYMCMIFGKLYSILFSIIKYLYHCDWQLEQSPTMSIQLLIMCSTHLRRIISIGFYVAQLIHCTIYRIIREKLQTTILQTGIFILRQEAVCYSKPEKHSRRITYTDSSLYTCNEITN